MHFSLPLALCVAVWAAAAQAQVTAPVTISPLGPIPQDRTSPVITNSASVGAVPASQNSPSAGASPTEAAPHPRRPLRQRFEEANTTHDGRLTPEQAQASWPSIAKHFAEIDKDKHGYVTLDDIRLYRREHRHHNGMQGAGTGPGTPATGMSGGGKGKATTGAPETDQ